MLHDICYMVIEGLTKRAKTGIFRHTRQVDNVSQRGEVMNGFSYFLYTALIFVLLLVAGGTVGVVVGIVSTHSVTAAVIAFVLLSLAAMEATHCLCRYLGGDLAILGKRQQVSLGWFNGMRNHLILRSWAMAMAVEVVGIFMGYAAVVFYG